MPYLMLLVKVFGESRFADEFILGNLYANRLSHFKRIEDEDVRGDKYEGAILRDINHLIVMPRHRTTGRILDTIHIPERNLQGPMVIRTSNVERFHVFCMSSAYVPDEDTETLSQTRPDEIDYILTGPKGIREFGRHAVVITRPKAFIRRVETAAKLRGIDLQSGLVNYYDEQRGTPAEPHDKNIIFNKRDKYARQQEFRFAFDTGDAGVEPLILNVGDLGKMAHRADVKGDGLMFRIMSSGRSPL